MGKGSKVNNYIFTTAFGVFGAFLFEILLRFLRNRGKISVTKLIFVSTQISALIWVFTSYAIAIYATVVLEQVYTMSELSEPAITTILGVSFLKVLENIFEHNDGSIFGKSGGGESEK